MKDFMGLLPYDEVFDTALFLDKNYFSDDEGVDTCSRNLTAFFTSLRSSRMLEQSLNLPFYWRITSDFGIAGSPNILFRIFVKIFLRPHLLLFSTTWRRRHQ